MHFYETFLSAYDPAMRESRGVYYTPEPVVSYIVRSVDWLLRTRFDKPKGLADESVYVLDPADRRRPPSSISSSGRSTIICKRQANWAVGTVMWPTTCCPGCSASSC